MNKKLIFLMLISALTLNAENGAFLDEKHENTDIITYEESDNIELPYAVKLRSDINGINVWGIKFVNGVEYNVREYINSNSKLKREAMLHLLLRHGNIVDEVLE